MADALSVDIVDSKGDKTGSVELPAEIFDVEPNIPLMHQVVVAQLAAARQGTHATTTVQNLKVRGVDADKGVLIVGGAIPGPKGAVVLVRTAVKGA